MRVALVFFIVLVVGIWAREISKEEVQNFRNIREKCESNFATRADVDLLKHLSQNVNNPEVGAYMLCMSVGAGFQQQNGHIDLDVMKNKIYLLTGDDKSQVDDLVTNCAVQKDTPEKTAVNMLMCLDQNHKLL